MKNVLHNQKLIASAIVLAASLFQHSAPQTFAQDTAPATVAAAPAKEPALIEEIDLRDAPLRDALTLIGKAAGVNLAASDDAAKTKVTIHLRNVAPLTTVQAICQTHGLFFNRKATEEGIDIVTTVKEFQDGLTVFHEEKTEVYTLLYPNAVDLASAIRDLFGSRVKLSLGNGSSDNDEIQRRFDKFDQLDSHSQGVGFSLGGSNGNSSGNSGSRTSSSVSSSGVLTSGTTSDTRDTPQGQNDLSNLTPQQLKQLAGLLKPASGGGVDADLLAGLGRNNNSPIHISVLSRNNQVIVRTSDVSVLEEINRLKAKIDVPTPQVLLEMKILSVDLGSGFRSIFDMQFGDKHNTAGFSTGDILPPPSANAPALTIGGTGAGAGSPFALTPSAAIYQFVNDNFRLRIQLLENANRVTTLATPILLVANNEVSRVFIGQNRPIVTNISSQSTAVQGVIQNTPNTNFTLQPVGTTLLITPNINADRTVTLRLVQETSSVITGGATIPVLGANGTVTNAPVDVVSAQTLTGTLVAKDGLSLALGGLIEEGVQDNNEEVPVLGKLPYIGVMFRRQVTGRYRRETIIVIRPYILSTPSEAEGVGKRLTEANSIHPKITDTAPEAGKPIGALDTFLPRESLKPNPPHNELEDIFKFHKVLPTD